MRQPRPHTSLSSCIGLAHLEGTGRLKTWTEGHETTSIFHNNEAYSLWYAAVVSSNCHGKMLASSRSIRSTGRTAAPDAFPRVVLVTAVVATYGVYGYFPIYYERICPSPTLALSRAPRQTKSNFSAASNSLVFSSRTVASRRLFAAAKASSRRWFAAATVAWYRSFAAATAASFRIVCSSSQQPFRSSEDDVSALTCALRGAVAASMALSRITKGIHQVRVVFLLTCSLQCLGMLLLIGSS